MVSQKHSIFFLSFLLFSLFSASAFAAKKSYIVYLGSHAHGKDATEADYDRVAESHYKFLESFLGSPEKAKEALFYSYQRHINGFAAVLDEEQAAEIEKHPDVVSVFLNQKNELHTTHSWNFMDMEDLNGFVPSNSLFKKARFGEDTIIANLDTGVWPESPSFNDEGMGPIPKRWKGTCENDSGVPFRCNKKLIGARYFSKGYASFEGEIDPTQRSARDYEGHGSHTLSTAGGNLVPGASVFGVGNGTAKGGSPRARVAAYKVCWKPKNGSECYTADIMKAFDMAIHDGVDVISVSLGGSSVDYIQDGIAIASFHAIKRGITVVFSAGNSGPRSGTVTNIAPWMLTVGASTLDRKFEALVKTQNGKIFKGTSLSKALPENKFYPLIDSAQAKMANATVKSARLCKVGSVDPEKVKGKILVCLRGESARVEKGLTAVDAGAVGMILCNDEASGNELIADPHLLPASQITYKDGVQLFKYINSTKTPMGTLMPPVGKFNAKPAPSMAAFSSRGPNTITPEILKPDVTAPGVNIIAAYTGAAGPTELSFDKRRVSYVTMSGTSMSCPHVSGVAGLLKTLHPDWSPSAIKSAIMTSARTRDNTHHPMQDSDHSKATPLMYGLGHIRPNRAMDPGLVYDLTPNDYLDFLCALGYNESKIKPFSETPYRCPKSTNIMDLNYPSISIPKLYGSVTVNRKVKNVGTPGTYKVSVHEPAASGISISVEPSVLKFDKAGEEKNFKVTILAKVPTLDTVYGGFTWSDGKHFVRSTIVVGGVRDNDWSIWFPKF